MPALAAIHPPRRPAMVSVLETYFWQMSGRPTPARPTTKQTITLPALTGITVSKLSSEVQILSNVSDMVLFELCSGAVSETEVTEGIEMIGSEKVAGLIFKQR